MTQYLIPRACYGRPNGLQLSPEEFIKRAGNNYKLNNIYPYCPECDEKLIIVNVSSTLNNTFYKHYDLANDIDSESIEVCSLRSKKSNRQGWYCSSFDFSRGAIIRDKFLEKDNLLKAYCFCWSLCGKGNLSLKQFHKMIKLANKKKIWSYVGVELWMIPYMLLTLCDFQHHKGFAFHFILHKNQNNHLNIAEIFSSSSQIQKVFSNSQRLMGKSPNNPLDITESNYLQVVDRSYFITNSEFSEKLYDYISEQVGIRRPHSYNQ